MSGPYTLTVNLAYPGTPLFDSNGGQVPTGKTSLPGHMWFQVSDGRGDHSYGFQPQESGTFHGPGKAVDTDSKVYQNPGYSVTWEVTAEQYQRLREYGEDALDGDKWSHFNGQYHAGTNNCVDFTWGALKHADLQRSRTVVDYLQGELRQEQHQIEEHFDGRLKVMPNREALRTLVPPVPGSPLNQERENPPPERSWRQRLLTENDTPDTAQPEPERQAAQPMPSPLSPVSQTLLHDARREVQGVAQQHGLAWEQGLENTVWSLAAAARQQGFSRIEMSHVEAGQIRIGQMDHGQLRVTEVNARQAANTDAGQSAQALGAADQQAQALEREQQAQQALNAHTPARSGPVLA